MIASLIAVVVAAFLTIQTVWWPVKEWPVEIATLFTIVGSLFLLAMILSNFLALIPVQRSSKRTSPKVLELFSSDPKQRWAKMGIVLFIFYSFLAPLYITEEHLPVLVVIWIVLLGCAIDFFRLWSHRVLAYCNPSVALKQLKRSSIATASGSQQEKLFPWIDSLTETAIRSIDNVGTSLAIDTLDAMSQTSQAFLQTATANRIKLISGEERDEYRENVSYTLFYLFDRMETVFNKALTEGSDMTAVSVITTLGKISIFTAKHDPQMASFPVHFIGKFSRRAVIKGMQDVGIKASYTLQEVAKILAEEKIFAGGGFEDLFLSIVKNLDDLSKELFRCDKSINVLSLIAPFAELKKLMNHEQIKDLPEIGKVTNEIDNVIEDFQALQQVVVNVPEK